MKQFKYINTGEVVKLSDLIESEDIDDRSIIKVYNADGKFVTKGNWFQDHILDWVGSYGTAKKAGVGLTVSFHLT